MNSLSPPNRLVHLLREITSLPGDTSTRQLWAKIFSLQPSETAKILEQVAAVILLVASARQVVTEAVGELNLHLHLQGFSHIENALSSLNLDANARGLVEGANEALRGLQFSADLVDRVAPAIRLDDQLLSQLQRETDSLLEQVVQSDLEPALKDLLRKRFEAVREAILNIRISGPEAVEAALDGLAGAYSRAGTNAASDAKPGIAKRLADYLDLGYKATQLAESVPRIAAGVMKLIAATSGAPTDAI